MAKLSSINKNNRRRKMSASHAKRRAGLKAVIMNKETSMEDRFAAQMKLSSMPRNGAKTRVKNRCELTGRARGFYRKFKLSRIKLRELGSVGKVPGLVKSSW